MLRGGFDFPPRARRATISRSAHLFGILSLTNTANTRGNLAPSVLVAVLLASCLAVGCNVRRPRLLQPGHIYNQQLESTYFDPYPVTKAAPTDQGARPLQYLVPRDEPVRSQWFFGRPG